jgi:hypothetical protein
LWYSDNVQSADNQQERLISIGWVIGFVDGEGCFSVSVIGQPDRINRKGYKTGYQLTHEFVVTQGARSVECLQDLRVFFGVGGVYRNVRHDNHREDLCTFNVSRRSDLLRVVIPFFREYPLRTAKRGDFDKFAWCVEMIDGGRHLTHHGLADVLEVVQTMNRQKPRSELIGILRGHTPGPETLGEDMVQAAWRHAEDGDEYALAMLSEDNASNAPQIEIPCRVSGNEPVPSNIGEARTASCGCARVIPREVVQLRMLD